VSTAAAKVVYCHSPARWLYQPDDYLARLPRWARLSFRASTLRLRRSDTAAALRAADAYVVNSTVVADRVRVNYGIEPQVVPPARGLQPEGKQTPVPGIEPGYLLTVGRRRGYKRIPAICDAVAAIPGERLVVVGADDLGGYGWPSSIVGVTGLTDSQMRWLYANAAGLIAVAQEDFGLTPVEAQSFGIPSLVLRSGGYVDSTIEGVTGLFVDDADVTQLVDGIRALRARTWEPDKIKVAGERFAPDMFARRMQDVVSDAMKRHITH
jgi:glycosyltransferase involved in cell wall biosynthesis